ncbi:MAG: alpha/beta hydrolase [Cyanobacteria bacterium J06632_19]
MSISRDSFDVLWVSGSPSLRCFNMPLIKRLSQHQDIAGWEYFQTLDEPGCMDTAVGLLRNYLETKQNPIHLIGHGIGGTIALMFARQYPQYVKSLSLLSVAAQPANTWHVNYYQQRQIYSLSRAEALLNTIHNLFREEITYHPRKLINQFNKDLNNLPLMHSLFDIEKLPVGGVSVPLMICGGQVDPILSYLELYKWKEWLKPGDIIWKCPQGSHFFHSFYPDLVCEEILKFWHKHQMMTLKKDFVQSQV